MNNSKSGPQQLKVHTPSCSNTTISKEARLRAKIFGITYEKAVNDIRIQIKTIKSLNPNNK